MGLQRGALEGLNLTAHIERLIVMGLGAREEFGEVGRQPTVSKHILIFY